MKRIRMVIGVLSLAFLFASCTVTVIQPETKVKAQNDLVDLSVPLQGGGTKLYQAIDLHDVWIGDVNFPYIQGGDVTTAKTTSRSGNVSVDIGSVDAITSTRTITIQPIDPFDAYISAGVTNTVVFDEATAGDILSVLYKRKAQ